MRQQDTRADIISPGQDMRQREHDLRSMPSHALPPSPRVISLIAIIFRERRQKLPANAIDNVAHHFKKDVYS